MGGTPHGKELTTPPLASLGAESRLTGTVRFDEVDSREYDGILVPGGWAPDKLRRFPKVL